ncbi:hypothetical protein D9M68_523480 [compost metagenome]
MTLATSALILTLTAADTPLGASSDTKELTSSEAGPPASAMVGTSGICGMRLGAATAM